MAKDGKHREIAAMELSFPIEGDIVLFIEGGGFTQEWEKYLRISLTYFCLGQETLCFTLEDGRRITLRMKSEPATADTKQRAFDTEDNIAIVPANQADQGITIPASPPGEYVDTSEERKEYLDAN